MLSVGQKREPTGGYFHAVQSLRGMKVAYKAGMRLAEKISVCEIKFLAMNMNHRLTGDHCWTKSSNGG
jgi:hypothetical protein